MNQSVCLSLVLMLNTPDFNSSPLGLILMNQSVCLSLVLMLNTPDFNSSPFSMSVFRVKLAMLQAWSYFVSGSLSVKDHEVDTIGGFFTPGAAGAFTLPVLLVLAMILVQLVHFTKALYLL